MAKSELRIKAREERKKGESVKEIAEKIGVSKSTVSLWVRDVILSVKQMEVLKKRKIKGWELARLKGSLVQKQKRLQLIERSKKQGIKTFGNLTKREFLIAGIALYWGEGSKTKRSVRICNSDPKLIKFIIKWFKEILGVRIQDIRVAVGINQIHKNREEVVRRYWSKITGIPLDQFRKTSFKKVKNQKLYANFSRHYGNLMVEVLKSAKYYYKIMGLIEGLASQGSSMAERRFHKTRVVGSTPTPGTI